MRLEYILLSNAIPAFILLSVAETVYLYKERRVKTDKTNIYVTLEPASGTVLIKLVFKASVLFIFTFIYKYRLFTIPNYAGWVFVLLYSIQHPITGCTMQTVWNTLISTM